MSDYTGHSEPGNWARRTTQNPEEKRFADAWKKEHVLHHLLGNGAFPRVPTKEEAAAAATVIQWLGSPVGQGFLSDLGYARAERAARR